MNLDLLTERERVCKLLDDIRGEIVQIATDIAEKQRDLRFQQDRLGALVRALS